jgi:hypothetical protein
LNKRLKKNLFGKNKHQINGQVFKKILEENPDIENYLNSILEAEPAWKSIRNIFFGILNDEKLKTCKVCNKILHYGHRGEYCSKRCINNDPEIITKANQR